MTFLLSIFGLLGISLFLIGSVSPHLLFPQMSFFLLGLVMFFTFAKLNYQFLLKFIWPIYIFSLLFLTASLFGPEVRGATRWVEVLGVRLQPSEVVKPFMIMFFVFLFTRELQFSLFSLGKMLFFLSPFLLLIFKQPDLGNVLVYLIIFISLLIMAGFSLRDIFFLGLALASFFPFFWFILKSYQRARLLSFLSPQLDPIGAGYNALQAAIAVGSGQFFGWGLGRGTQSRLFFLPEYQTDFIFAALTEALGFLGGGLVIFFYLILLARILVIAKTAPTFSARLLALGVFAQIFSQVFINIGMNLGILPITGVTLPLLSYGGSSILGTFIGLGIVASVDRRRRESPLVIR